MGLILDSSVVIAAERLGQTAYQMLEAISQQKQDPEIAISVVTVVELAHGIARADTPQRRAGRQQFLDDLLAGMPVHPVTVPIALRAGQADGQMQAAGKRMALADLLIGSTALELGYSVATANLRHFALLPDLLIEQL
ncbi:MAG TPA: PIN domain-containing protein [Bryobacteraceae bacterium]|nr:PIN domain-containing protein [Bryobacteraceae bacterium]